MTDQKQSIPSKLLTPIKDFLETKLVSLKRQEKMVKSEDPFKDSFRTLHNSAEDDLDEQIGHFDNEVKVGFIKKQIVQLRKALTSMKLGKYGICDKCGKMIDTDRLAISPETTICVKCAKESE